MMRIHTLDWFEGAARSVINLVRAGKGGNWPVPMRALTHADLAAGRPEIAQAFLSDPMMPYALEFGQDLLRRQRNSSYLNLAEYQGNEDETS